MPNWILLQLVAPRPRSMSAFGHQKAKLYGRLR